MREAGAVTRTDDELESILMKATADVFCQQLGAADGVC